MVVRDVYASRRTGMELGEKATGQLFQTIVSVSFSLDAYLFYIWAQRRLSPIVAGRSLRELRLANARGVE